MLSSKGLEVKARHGNCTKKTSFSLFPGLPKRDQLWFHHKIEPFLGFQSSIPLHKPFFYSSRITDEGAASLIVSLCASEKYPFQSKPGLWTGCWLRVATQMPPSAILSDPKKKCGTEALIAMKFMRPIPWWQPSKLWSWKEKKLPALKQWSGT